MDTQYDGFISKHINRKLSEPVAQILAKTSLTPNQVSWGALGLAILSFVSFIFGQNILGGILAQLCSITDGVDGSLARLKGKASVFGGFLDAILDRCADTLIVLGMILWSLAHEGYPGIWLVGFLAIVGTLSVSYTRARIDPEHRHLFDKGLASVASRDVRLFLAMMGCVAGQVYFCLLTLAILTNLVVLYRLIHSYRYLNAKDRQSESPLPAAEVDEKLPLLRSRPE